MNDTKKPASILPKLIGAYFLTYTHNEKLGKKVVAKQGMITDISGNFAMVSYFEWATGGLYCQSTVHLGSFVSNSSAELFTNKSDFEDAVERYSPKDEIN